MSLQLGLFAESDASSYASAVGPAAQDEQTLRLARALPEGLRLGTSSWSFPGWSGIVYDRSVSERVLARTGLTAYSQHPLFRAVGVDRTYYRPISAETFRSYAEEVPDGFRFLVKASRRLTSPTDPDAPGRRAANPDFLDPVYAIREVVTPAMEGLGSKLGPLLFQFSPGPADAFGGPRAFADRVARFLQALPQGPLYAVELRTADLLTERYAEALASSGAAHGYTVHPAMPSLERQTALMVPHYQPALVVRWMLHSGLRYEAARRRYDPFDQLVDQDVATRHAVATTVLDALIAEREAFVIANNKAEGSAPLTLRALADHVVAWRSDPPGETGR